MSRQNYSNHVRYYPAHHFVFYPLITLLFGAAIYGYYHHLSVDWIWISIGVSAFFIGALSFMMRQHYALMLQNRIVLLEIRFRYYTLTQEKFDPIEKQLSFAQIAALRFAGDEELTALIEKTLREDLSADQIKKSIVHWRADDWRV